MYLTEPKLFDIVKKQFIFKMNASGAAFTTLIILQIITSLTGTIGTGRFPKFSEYPNVEFILTSNDGSVALTILWAIILGGLITSNARKNESFAFVSTRISHHLSNMIFMLTASIISGITAALMGSAIKLFAFLKYGDIIVNTPGLLANPTEFFARRHTHRNYRAKRGGQDNTYENNRRFYRRKFWHSSSVFRETV